MHSLFSPPPRSPPTNVHDISRYLPPDERLILYAHLNLQPNSNPIATIRNAEPQLGNQKPSFLFSFTALPPDY